MLKIRFNDDRPLPSGRPAECRERFLKLEGTLFTISIPYKWCYDYLSSEKNSIWSSFIEFALSSPHYLYKIETYTKVISV